MRAKKVIVGVAISAMLISSSIPVMAFSVTNGNKTFDKKWELSTTSDGGKGVLTYGYNTLAKLATTSSTGGLLLALQRAIVTARPKGRYRKHFCWPAIKRYYSNLLVSILLLALLYTFELLHLLYCQSFQHNIL